MTEWIAGKYTTETQRAEQKGCESFKVFIEVAGFFTKEKKEMVLGKGATVLDAQHKIGQPPVESRIRDGNGLPVKPNDFLWQHSKDCTLSLTY
jgi:hypothetical protein